MRSKREQHSPRKSRGTARRAACLAESGDLSAADATQRPPTRLQVYVAGQILALIRQYAMNTGQPLREEALAQRLGVSRTSVRGGLRLLASQKIVDARPHRGYVLHWNASEIEEGIELPPSSDERLYLQIVRDYLSGAALDNSDRRQSCGAATPRSAAIRSVFSQIALSSGMPSFKKRPLFCWPRSPGITISSTPGALRDAFNSTA